MAKKKAAGRKGVKRIDVHSHVVPREMLDALTQKPERLMGMGTLPMPASPACVLRGYHSFLFP